MPSQDADLYRDVDMLLVLHTHTFVDIDYKIIQLPCYKSNKSVPIPVWNEAEACQ